MTLAVGAPAHVSRLQGVEAVDDSGMDEWLDIDPEAYQAGQRKWKLDPHVPLAEKIQRSLTREAKLFKAQQRLQAQVEKLAMVIEPAQEKFGDRNTRIKEVFALVESEKNDRAQWERAHEEQEYLEDSSDHGSEASWRTQEHGSVAPSDDDGVWDEMGNKR